jgi:hypothetical protein
MQRRPVRDPEDVRNLRSNPPAARGRLLRLATMTVYRAAGATMMRDIRLTLAAIAAASAILLGACGGGDATPSTGPRLANSPIPTVTPLEGTPIICGPDTPLALPDDFPTDEVTVPPDFVVWTVERSPHLRVVGTVNPPEDQNGRQPWNVVSDALIGPLQKAGWTISLNDKIEGRDYDFMRADGRTGHFLAQPRNGCTGSVNLTYDINWITG